MKKIILLGIVFLLFFSCSRITVIEATYTNQKNYRIVYERADYMLGFKTGIWIWEETILTKDGVDSFIENSYKDLSGWSD